MTDSEYFYTGNAPINTSLMKEVVCKTHVRSRHNGLCSVSTKPIPPKVYRKVMQDIVGTNLPPPLPEVVEFYRLRV